MSDPFVMNIARNTSILRCRLVSNVGVEMRIQLKISMNKDQIANAVVIEEWGWDGETLFIKPALNPVKFVLVQSIKDKFNFAYYVQINIFAPML